MASLKSVAALVIIGLLLAPTAYAHHLWVIKDGEGFMVARGNAPDKIQDYDPASVKEVKAFDRNGNSVPVTKKISKSRVSLQTIEDISMITVWCDWGYRVNTTDGKKLMTRREAEQAGFNVVESFFSTQFAKSLFKAGTGVTKAVGLPFEIVPLKDPLALGNGEQLPVQLIFQGKPLAETVIISGDGQETKTDKEGVARIKTTMNGMHIFSARHKTPEQNSTETDYHLFTTFLTFETKK